MAGKILGIYIVEKGSRPTPQLMIGDRLHDIAGARANGIRSVGVLWGFGSHEELSGAGATTLCNSPWNLTDCVRL